MVYKLYDLTPEEIKSVKVKNQWKVEDGMNALLDQTFLHGVDLSDWLPCHNLRLCNFLSSPNSTDFNANKSRQHNPITNGTIDELRRRVVPSGFLQPRFAKIVNNNSLWNLEIDVEETRRKYNPKAPSRLSCLYLSENSEKGRAMIKNMFPQYKAFTVKITHLNSIHLADINWFDEFIISRNLDLLRKYWAGEPSKKPRWEFLLDGRIEFIDKDELDIIRQYGAVLPGV
ncbi:hypothetical protein A3F08_03090 [Candidatus Berkelbacteria bacterium RIFCSPHIGHO2_12_FULL_36_9]|uniref:Uncharacterized protein n=1 Tax=Candidatus Berkelbacteria bacterium RIFCSPHIGHO2_12_FULL_36_9 TaxID=1797469 RepID=A0A1F5EHF3_9BACT|nr:MAG: hypothetical protein A3F08_03090 [Candidatus Berkelbacteria bacterium RIFCSPHIGHO2_12_FULL_36_9]